MIRVLVVDDSLVMQKILTESLASARDIEVIGKAKDPYEARDKIVALKPQVITLDIEMPRMNGLTFLKKLMKFHPQPVVIISSHAAAGSEAALLALEYGAVEVLGKPDSATEVKELSHTLKYKIRAAALARIKKNIGRVAIPVKPQNAVLRNMMDKVLAIGASTGGTEAIKQILGSLPNSLPGTVIVQHLPAAFTPSFVKHLNELCNLDVREARGGEYLEPGLLLVAPGDSHLLVKRSGMRFVTQVKYGPPVYYQRPSVEVLFNSVAKHAGNKAVGVLLTGMGEDGARGLLAMRQTGAHTIAQDEKTSVVYGMPKVAADLGAAQAILPLERIPGEIIRAFQKSALHSPKMLMEY